MHDGRLYLQGWFEMQLDVRTFIIRSSGLRQVWPTVAWKNSKLLTSTPEYELELSNSTRSRNIG